MWFVIKKQSALQHDTQHFLQMMELCRQHLNDAELSVVIPVLQNGAYFAHSESVLFSMLGQERADVRAEALTVIQRIRSNTHTNDQHLRSFRVPSITGQEASFQDLLRANEYLFEPPLSQGKSLEDL